MNIPLIPVIVPLRVGWDTQRPLGYASDILSFFEKRATQTLFAALPQAAQ